MTETLLINVKQQTMSSASNFILNQIIRLMIWFLMMLQFKDYGNYI